MAHGPPAAQSYHGLVLVGFMGAGKTTVGRIVAGQLGWHFIDVDEEIVRREGESVAEIFRRRGEAAFRDVERNLTDELCRLDDTVLAPGGGWILQSAALESLPRTTLVVWLRVSVPEALRRLSRSQVERPLLAGPDPTSRARDLLREREAVYRRAGRVVETDGRDPEDIAREIAGFLRSGDNGNEER